MKFVSILVLLFALVSCRANPNSGFGTTYNPGGGSTGTTGPVIGHVSLTLNIQSSTHKGLYLWVITSSNAYVDTIQRYLGAGSGQTGDNPTNWKHFAGTSSVDGVTSATLINNSSYTPAVWDCKDRLGQDVAYGTYKVWLEICQQTGGTLEYSGTIVITSNSNTSGTLVPTDGTMASGTITFTTN